MQLCSHHLAIRFC